VGSALSADPDASWTQGQSARNGRACQLGGIGQKLATHLLGKDGMIFDVQNLHSGSPEERKFFIL
jgi:hypothetical protein